MDKGASSGDDRATAAEPVVSALRDSVPSAGRSIRCDICNGHGLVSSWSFGVKEPDECGQCHGSGQNWLYPGGAIARYYSGPLIGRLPAKAIEAQRAETQGGSVHESAVAESHSPKEDSHD